MNNSRATALCGILLFPFYALASGGEILLPISIQLASVVVLIILLLSIRLRKTYKLIIAASYLLTLSLIVYSTSDIPYTQNKTALNIALTIGPGAAALVTFIFLKAKHKKEP
jgi:hypothetical protein